MADNDITQPIAFELVLKPYEEGVAILAQNFVNALTACYVVGNADTEQLATSSSLQQMVFAQFHSDVPIGKIAMDLVAAGIDFLEDQELTLCVLGCPIEVMRASIKGLGKSIIDNEKELRP